MDQLEPQNSKEEDIASDDLKSIEHRLELANPRLFEGVNKKKKEEILRSVTFTLIESHSGPLPLPRHLEQYDAVIPNGAERIMQMAENEQNHRHEMDKKVLPKHLNITKRGQVFGFIIALVVIGSGSFLAYEGHETVGSILVGTTVVSLVSVFVIGKVVK